MRKFHIYCDKCQKEVSYHLLPRYNVDDTLRDIVRRRVMEIEHLCEPCMHRLNSLISEAIDKWKKEETSHEQTTS